LLFFENGLSLSKLMLRLGPQYECWEVLGTLWGNYIAKKDFCFWWDWGFNSSQLSTAWATPPVHFALIILVIVSWTICPSWS
jgi:hypothetical protein